MRWLVKAVTGVVAVAVGLMYGIEPAAAGSTDVVLVGDSLLGQTSDEVTPLLQGQGWRVTLESVSGSGLTAGATAVVPHDWPARMLQLEQQRDPAVVVIVLGTNDAVPVSRGERYPPHIERMLATTDARRIYWADCSQHTAVAERNSGCRIIQGALFDAKNRWSGLNILPYDAEVASDPRHYGYDSVHLSQWGQDRFASLISRYVGSAK